MTEGHARDSQPVSDIDVPTETDVGWLSPERLELVRAHVPLVYVDAVPVRVDAVGRVTEIGLLLRVAADGTISRMVVSGRVLFGERVRDALLRHLEKDLGPLALPRLPTDPTPFTIVEYFPDPDRSGFHDPRHHAVSLAYVVPVDGDCQPTQEALDLAWFRSGRGGERRRPRADDRRPRPPHPPRSGPRRSIAVGIHRSPDAPCLASRRDGGCRLHPSCGGGAAHGARRPQDGPLRGAQADRCRRPERGARSSPSRATASISRSSGTTPWCCTRTCG